MTRARAVSGRDAVVLLFSLLTAAAYVYVILLAAVPQPFPSPSSLRPPELIERIARVIVPGTPAAAEPQPAESRPAEPADRLGTLATPDGIDSIPSGGAVGVSGTGTLSTSAEDAVTRPPRGTVIPSVPAVGAPSPDGVTQPPRDTIVPTAPSGGAPRPSTGGDGARTPGKTKGAPQRGDEDQQRVRSVRRSATLYQADTVAKRSPAPAKRAATPSLQQGGDATAPGKSSARANAAGGGKQADGHAPAKVETKAEEAKADKTVVPAGHDGAGAGAPGSKSDAPGKPGKGS